MTNYDMDEIRRRQEAERLREREKKSRGIETENEWEDLIEADSYAINYEKHEKQKKELEQQKVRETQNEYLHKLEDELNQVWNTSDDMSTILSFERTTEEFTNLLEGLKQIHDARMQKLWSVFESGFDKYKYKHYQE
jgi:hypothetical protein